MSNYGKIYENIINQPIVTKRKRKVKTIPNLIKHKIQTKNHCLGELNINLNTERITNKLNEDKIELEQIPVSIEFMPLDNDNDLCYRNSFLLLHSDKIVMS